MSKLWAKIWDIRTGNACQGIRIRKRIPRQRIRCPALLTLLITLSIAVSASTEVQGEESLSGMRICVPYCGNGLGKIELIAEKKGKELDRLIVNPDGNIDSIGIPTLGDLFDFIDRNPEKAMELIQDTRQWPYLTVAAGIIAIHDKVMANGGRPIPAHLRKTLRRWYPDDLLNVVRWTSLREPIKRFLQDFPMNFDDNTLAVTVINAVIFRSDDLANDGALWAHELYHVQQYSVWGVFGFAKRWVDNASINGPVEAPAYTREAEARPFFSPR
jgi:hypothetical protein